MGLYITNPGVLSIFSTGKFTGIVVDSGESFTQFAPIFDGCLLSNSILRMNLSGGDVTNNLIKLFYEGNVYRHTIAKRHFERIKEEICYVALDFEQEIKNYKKKIYEMPDSEEIEVKN